jgi:excisionase family DNA binding protein
MERLMATVAETADALGISEASVRRLCRDGQLPHRRYGRRLLIPKQAIEAEVEQAMRVAR